MRERQNASFRVMCEMWGLERAIKKAKEFGIPVSQEEIDEQRAEEERKRNALKTLLKAIREQEGK